MAGRLRTEGHDGTNLPGCPGGMVDGAFNRAARLGAAVNDADALRTLQYLANVRAVLSAFRQKFLAATPPIRIGYDVEVHEYESGLTMFAWLEAERGEHLQCWSIDVSFRDAAWEIDARASMDNEPMPTRLPARKVPTFLDVEVETFKVLDELLAVPCLV